LTADPPALLAGFSALAKRAERIQLLQLAELVENGSVSDGACRKPVDQLDASGLRQPEGFDNCAIERR
jgi:hypothetical protein